MTEKLKGNNFPNWKPKLRFQGFEGEEWEVKKLGELCKMQAGKFVSASEIINEVDENLFPCYGANGLRGYTKSFNCDGEYSIVGRQGALCGNIVKVTGKFYATEHAVVVTTVDKINSTWMFYLLIHLNLNQYATGMAQPGLSVQNLKLVESRIPKSVKEQDTIASLLSLLDLRISTQKKIIQDLETLIKGYSEKIFSQKMRFKDKNGSSFSNWEINTLKNVLIKNSSKNKSLKYLNVQSVSNKFGFINQEDFFEDRRVASINTSNYYIIGKGDFAYNPSRIDVGSLAYKFDANTSIISPLYISFKANNNFLVDRYLLSWFSSLQFIRQMSNSFEGSVRNTLSYESLSKMSIFIPSIEEQTHIAQFLSYLTEKINLEKDLLVNYEIQKKYLLANLFV
ncbi:Type I restriction modification DNA specificity domain [Chryseobacterium nakagawai]|uniref:Restriction endonuclease subunit S n=1 Tax=Chryseobacterium nakagawai TaxID=1241982 RepID=A0AAD0YPD6_CHRNA|nr:restriction endonuclease subunit S [Chryseobacterium nakagawai]AZA93622.1 restriction endonuclease subunit S [Chryseobacterium nakagawai]VEH20324.1 Type I restriction modification DNA specificity domain [Chryseobacterium nakagawai]